MAPELGFFDSGYTIEGGCPVEISTSASYNFEIRFEHLFESFRFRFCSVPFGMSWGESSTSYYIYTLLLL